MAKKKPSADLSAGSSYEDAIAKKFKSAIQDGTFITDQPKKIISVGPCIDIALGGGIPEGSFVVFTGPEKCGKTITALNCCKNAQKQHNKKVYYANVEARMKKRDLEGIRDLVYDDEKLFKLVCSTKGNILSGEDYLEILEMFIKGDDAGIAVLDSYSALASSKELTNNLTDVHVAPIQKTLALWCRRIAPVLPLTNVTMIGITHQMANINPMAKKAKIEKSSSAVKYQTDVKLECSYFKELVDGDKIVGLETHWKVITTALNGFPGTKFKSYIKYGTGIWESMELVELGEQYGFIGKKGSWFEYDGHQIQGQTKLANMLDEEPELATKLKNDIYELVLGKVPNEV